MTIPRYLTVDPIGRIYEVSELRDRFQEPTDDPAIATACIVQLLDGTHQAWPIDDFAIYTVH